MEYLCTAIYRRVSSREVFLYKNTPMNDTQFDSMGNNGYNIDDIDAPGLMIDYPIFLNPNAGIASMTPSPPVTLETANDGGIGDQ